MHKLLTWSIVRPMNDRLTTKLREWRIANDLTVQEVSDLTGVNIAHISRAERGLARFSPLRKVTIARRLGVRVADLFDVEPIDDDEQLQEATS